MPCYDARLQATSKLTLGRAPIGQGAPDPHAAPPKYQPDGKGDSKARDPQHHLGEKAALQGDLHSYWPTNGRASHRVICDLPY